jgi:hypothetical protein
MTAARTASLCFSIVLTSAAATARQNSQTTDTQPAPTTTITETTYPRGGFIPFRRVERRTESGGRKILIERVEAPGVEGNWQPLEEVVTETTSAGSSTATTKRDVVQFDPQGQRSLTQTTQVEQETKANGDGRTVENTWTIDLNGQRGLTSRRIEETRSVGPGVKQTDSTLFLLTPEMSLGGAERIESTQHQVDATELRHDSRLLLRDVNDGWQPVETRSGEVRGTSSESVQEETVRGLDISGNLTLQDKIVTRTSASNGEQQVVIETYSQGAEGFVRSDSRLALKERVRRSLTTTADGGRYSVEELEARNPQAPNDPMRVVQRTVVSVRQLAPGRWQTERQLFERDANDRLVLVTSTNEEASGR